MTAPGSHTDLALMKYVKGRIFQWLCKGHVQTLPWWSMWSADCTKVAHTLRHHLMKYVKVECSDDSAKVTYIPHHRLMTYVKGRMFCWLHQGLVPTSPSLEEACKRWNVQMIATRSPADLAITWWCEGQNVLTCWPCHQLKKYVDSSTFSSSKSPEQKKHNFWHILLTTKVSMWIPPLSPLQSHLNKRNTTLDIYYWQQNLCTRLLILITQFHLKAQMAGSNQWVLFTHANYQLFFILFFIF